MKVDGKRDQLVLSEEVFSSIFVALSVERIGEQMAEKGRQASYILVF